MFNQPLASVDAYEAFIYDLPNRFASIRLSTLVVIRHGVYIASVEGEVWFDEGLVLSVVEEIDFTTHAIIQRYSYQVDRQGQRLYWYDSWPHPGDSLLSSTHPHHEHVPPDMKHNRIPAPGLSFDVPSLPVLIEEIKRELLSHRHH
jgi:hypothetical protein